MSVSIWTTSGI